MLSIIMPVYNEKNTIREVIKRVKDVYLDKEIIIVDDGSTDGTREILKNLESNGAAGIKVLYHEANKGKGAAIRTALHDVSGEFVAIQDADLEYDPQEFPRLIAPIIEGKADVVYGSRFKDPDSQRVVCLWHMIVNRMLSFLSNLFSNLNLTDMETCYKVFKFRTLKNIKIQEDRFGFEPEVTAKLARLQCRFYEVPISYSRRTYPEGKKIGWKDGIRALWCILKYNTIAGLTRKFAHRFNPPDNASSKGRAWVNE